MANPTDFRFDLVLPATQISSLTPPQVIELINRDYPRGGIAQPGLTAGTCLRKDFTFSEERSAAPGKRSCAMSRSR